MRDVILHDLRVEGDAPDGDAHVIRVRAADSLNAIVTRIRSLSLAHGGDIRLKVFAHGFERGGRCGLGIQIGRDDLTLGTVQQLRPLNGMIAYGIDLYACGAAAMQPGSRRKHGNGRVLCSQIARETSTFVRAAELSQEYLHFPSLLSIDFGEWEGRVLTFGPRGDIVQQQICSVE